MKTAEKLIKEYDSTEYYGYVLYTEEMCKHAMIEFAQQHVQAALQAASENVTTKTEWGFTGEFEVIDQHSILNAYPLENIK